MIYIFRSCEKLFFFLSKRTVDSLLSITEEINLVCGIAVYDTLIGNTHPVNMSVGKKIRIFLAVSRFIQIDMPVCCVAEVKSHPQIV